MPLTLAQETYYKDCVHELNRADFFGDCPHYLDMMNDEIVRLEALDVDYGKIKKKDLDDWSKVKPYGIKKGSEKKEVAVTTRTGIKLKKKGVPA